MSSERAPRIKASGKNGFLAARRAVNDTLKIAVGLSRRKKL